MRWLTNALSSFLMECEQNGRSGIDMTSVFLSYQDMDARPKFRPSFNQLTESIAHRFTVAGDGEKRRVRFYVSLPLEELFGLNQPLRALHELRAFSRTPIFDGVLFLNGTEEEQKQLSDLCESADFGGDYAGDYKLFAIIETM